MPITNVNELFVHELCQLYDAEHRFLEGQLVMVNKAADFELQKAIRNHILQTREHIRNLEQVFRELGQAPRRETCEVAQGLVNDAQQGIQEVRSDPLRDSLINAAVIKVEHFEIASYRGLVAAVQLMGEPLVVDALNENLGQEEETARTAEQSAEKLLQKAIRAEESQGEGLIDKVKHRLMGQ